MKQHKSTSKDNQLLSEMYGRIGGMTIQTTGNAGEAAEQLAQDDGFNSPEEAAEDSSKKEILSNLDQAIAQVDGIDEIDGLADALANVIDHYGQKHEDGEHHNQPHSEDEAYM